MQAGGWVAIVEIGAPRPLAPIEKYPPCRTGGILSKQKVTAPLQALVPYSGRMENDKCEALVHEDDREKCERPAERMIDPYMEEIYNEQVEVVLCSEHAQARRDDI